MTTRPMRQALMDWLEEQQDFDWLPASAQARKLLLGGSAALLRARQAKQNAHLASSVPSSPDKKSTPRQNSRPTTAAPVRAPKSAPSAATAPVQAAGPLGAGNVLSEIECAFSDLEALRSSFADCSLCGIAARRQHLVFGVGNPQADLVVIGEAPGAEEDRQGEPFVGPAGQLLDKILAAIGFARSDVYIANILKCRPTNNRDPNAEEVHNCSPYLLQQLALIRPKVILALGRVAGKTLLGVEESLASMRRKQLSFRGVPLVVTYHPAALLRNPHWKRPCWEDVQKAAALLKDQSATPGSLPPAKS